MSTDELTTIAGWGRHATAGRELRGEDLEELTEGAVLSRGLGRSYGDASLPPADRPEVVNTTLADRILAFDRQTGRIRAEAGLALSEINRLYMPSGWFSPVTPGTKYVTLGGMVAADVHGKNQHKAGNFGHHVTRMKMRLADGRVLECGPEEHADLFRATIGGMGLTGHILEVEFTLERIPSRWIWQESERIDDIDRFQEALVEAAPEWPYTMGWIDCLSTGKNLGRGILMKGRWATAEEAPAKPPRAKLRPRLPMDFPAWVLNRASIRAFNELYFWQHVPRKKRGFVDPESFFYPLDAMRDWYRMYGARGFTQYQCVLPREAGRGSARRMMEALTARGGASFLCVIKDFGQDGVGTLSFPRPGITIALDIAMRDDTQETVDALNQLVIAEGGRIYLAKDSLTRAEDFRRMEPRIEEFNRIRDRWDPDRHLKSAQSVRLLGD